MSQHISKITSVILMLLIGLTAFAQQKKVAPSINSTDTYKRTAFSLTENMHHYQYDVLNAGTYEVSVISPSGELISKPVKPQNFEQDATIRFEINSKYWKDGIYKIIIEHLGGATTVYRLKINPAKPYNRQ